MAARRRRRYRGIQLAVVAIVAVGAITFVAASSVATPSSANPRARSSCPRHLLPLQPNSISPAARAAVAREGAKVRPFVVSAILASNDRVRGPMVKSQCGLEIWRRTIIVYVRRQAALPAQSASQGVDFVGRFADGYHVWEVAH